MPDKYAGGVGATTGSSSNDRFAQVATPQRSAPTKKKDPWWKRALAAGPVKNTLDFVSRPAYAVGNLIEGDFGDAGKAMAPLSPFGMGASAALNKGDVAPNFNRVLPGQALANRGVLPDKGWQGGVSKFIADVALDPTTYVTFGVSGVAKSAAQKAGSEAIEQAARSGVKIDHALAARVAGSTAATVANRTKRIEVGVSIPFRRGPNKTKVLVGSKTAYNVLAKPVQVVGKTAPGRALQDVFRPGGTANPVVKSIWRAVENVSARDKADLDRRLLDLHRESLAVEKKLGMKRGAVAEALARHFDDPTNNPLPKGVDDIASRTDAVRQELQQAALDVGLLAEDDLVTNYISHLPADRGTARELMGRFGKPNPDNPFLTKHRIPGLETFAKWEAAGLKPELNVFKLLSARGHAAIDATGSRAAKDAIVEQIGVKGQKKAIPDLGGIALELDSAKAELAAMTKREVAATPFRVSQAAKQVERLEAKYRAARSVAAKAIMHNKKVARSPGRFVEPEEWRKIQGEYVKLGEEARGMVPREIADSLDRVMNHMGRTMSGPSAIYEAGYFINRLGSNWKSLAVLSPGFHFRNAYDDGLRAWFAGARNPASYMQAVKVLTGRDTRIKVDGRVVTGKQLEAEARALGVVDHGIISRDIPNQGELRTRRGASRPGEGRIAETFRKVGTGRENAFRLGTYIDLRRQGYSALEAAERVATHHFDYGDVSQFVAKARRFWLPFVTYSTKALPYLARQVVQRPGQVAAINKALTELENSGAPELDRSLLPVGQRLSVPIPGLGSEDNPFLLNPEGVAYFTTPNLFDPNQIQRQALAKLPNPMVRAPVEIGTQYSFYRGRRLPEKVRAPNWMQALAASGIEIPGFVSPEGPQPYRDVLTKDPVPGVRGKADTLYRLLPIYSQSDLVTGGAARDWQLGMTKYVLGAPVQKFDRLRVQQLADYFARREGQR